MANLLSTLVVDNVSYEIKDSYARQEIQNLGDALIYAGTLEGGSTGAYGALTPAANQGAYYKVSKAGKIDGITVEVGDVLICNTDNTPAATSSNYSTVVNNWDMIQVNVGPLGALAVKDSASGSYTVPTVPTVTGSTTITPSGTVKLTSPTSAGTDDVTISISGSTGENTATTVTPTITSTQTSTGANFTPSGDISSSTQVVTTISALSKTTSYLGASSTQGTKSTATAVTGITTTAASAITGIGTPTTASFVTGINANTTITAVKSVSSTTVSVPTEFNTTNFVTGYTAPTSAAFVKTITSTSANALTACAISGSYVTSTETLTISTSPQSKSFIATVGAGTTGNALTGLGTASVATGYSSVKTSATVVASVSATTDTAIKSLGTFTKSNAITALGTLTEGTFIASASASGTASVLTDVGNPSVSLASYTATATGRIAYISAVSGAVAQRDTVSSTFIGKPYALTVSQITVPKHSHSFSGSDIIHADFTGTGASHSHTITSSSSTKTVTVS